MLIVFRPGIRSFCSHLPQPTVLLRTLREIHFCVIRSMDRKSWTYARHSRLQGSHTRAPGRSAMSAQTRHLTRSLIPTVRKSLYGAVRHCARTKKSGKAARFQCDSQDDVTTATTNDLTTLMDVNDLLDSAFSARRCIPTTLVPS